MVSTGPARCGERSALARGVTPGEGRCENPANRRRLPLAAGVATLGATGTGLGVLTPTSSPNTMTGLLIRGVSALRAAKSGEGGGMRNDLLTRSSLGSPSIFGLGHMERREVPPRLEPGLPADRGVQPNRRVLHGVAVGVHDWPGLGVLGAGRNRLKCGSMKLATMKTIVKRRPENLPAWITIIVSTAMDPTN